MKFKLIRTDSEDPCKIRLQNGTHVFGRGKLLDCHDHRVSRKHGQLAVTDESLVLTALHQNPCFFIKAGTAETQILKQNCSHTFSNGDKFGVLPSSYWYEVLHCQGEEDKESDKQETTAENSLIDTQPVDYDTENGRCRSTERIDDQTCQEDEGHNGNSTDTETPIVTHNETDNDKVIDKENNPEDVPDEHNESTNANCDDSRPIDFNLDETDGNMEQPASPSLITGNQQSDNVNAQESTSEETIQQLQTSEETKSPQKRTHSTDTEDTSDGAKKIKTEPEDSPQSTQDVKPVVNVNQAGPSNSDNKDDVKQPAPQAPGRERCMYGANCYSSRRGHRRRVSFAQLECMLDVLKKNPSLATGYNKKLEDREYSRLMWIKIAQKLNTHNDGAKKKWKEWCKYWNDYKSKIKKLVAPSKVATGQSGDLTHTKPITDLEKKFLAMLGLEPPAATIPQQLNKKTEILNIAEPDPNKETEHLNIAKPKPANYASPKFQGVLTSPSVSCTQTVDPDSSVELQIDTRSNSPNSRLSTTETPVPANFTGMATINLCSSTPPIPIPVAIPDLIHAIPDPKTDIPLKEVTPPCRHSRHKRLPHPSLTAQQILMQIAKKRVEIDQRRARAEERRARTEERRAETEEQNSRMLYELVREIKEIKEILQVRRNPQHKAQFAHPSDPDWGVGERAPCPWGAACRKRDPRHWRDHDHPPGAHQPPQQRPGNQVVYRHGNIFYINAQSVNFYDDHFEAEDSDGCSVDYDYEF